MTPCEKIGLKVGDNIRVLQEGRIAPVGAILTLKSDDGSHCPEFITEKGEAIFFAVGLFSCPEYLPEGEGWERVVEEHKAGEVSLAEQLRKAIAKRDKHRAKLDKWSGEVERLKGELEREIEEETGLVCTIHHKQTGCVPDSSIPDGVQVHSDVPEGVDPDNPTTWKAGDIIQCIELNGGRGVYTVGKEYIVSDTDARAAEMYQVRSIDDEGDCMWGGAKFRFVRRPSEG